MSRSGQGRVRSVMTTVVTIIYLVGSNILATHSDSLLFVLFIPSYFPFKLNVI